ncbi:hypothetical protein BSR29_02460 [Boudabousia liubingyangii]|uniref:Lon proteolytic domain-containing protein n=1 Tax=Boudabousia liubingyangii TaxID=1921764 RepID=A0A1Q5PQL4_9ACTO|nr:S16 family serine protease [Boudabousia liubingyangii]OKL46080.1 hypothetical protein BSR28_08440 [Boudabousia liubingyangii]OKL49826.1 hypothetical protein BSR29_02460 [Boudabousia liubingyangii]
MKDPVNETQVFGYQPIGAAPKRRKRRGKGLPTLLVTALVVGLGAWFGFIKHYPYVIESPGPTLNVLAVENGVPFVQVPGHEPGPKEGKLRMVTVSLRGGPGNRNVTGIEMLQAYFSNSMKIEPYEKMFPEQISGAEETKIQRQYMESSMDNAKAAALTAAGIKFKSEIRVAGVAKNSDAIGKMEPGDIIRHLKAGERSENVDSTAELYRFLNNTPGGTVVTVGLETDKGENKEVEVKTLPRDDGKSGSRFGVYIGTKFEFPMDIKINVSENIGGPSAGTIFALAIYERIKGNELSGIGSVAGTGTIAPDGEVGPIGGVVQKIYGAKRDGAKFFLIPNENCKDLSGHRLPSGIQIVRTDDFKMAINNLESINQGKTDDLPTCPAE